MSDQTPYIIGADIGTSSAKTIGLRLQNGAVAGVFQQAYATRYPQPGYAEQDPLLLLDAVKKGIREVVSRAGHPPAAISFSSAMHSIMAADGDGQALTPLILWADNRSEPQALALRDTEAGKRLYRQTGTPVHAMSPLCKLRWLREQQPALFARAAIFPGIKEYIIHHFFGRYYSDHSIASATGLFDIAGLQWSREALDYAGITAAQLPEPVPATFRLPPLLPAVAAELGIPADTPFIIGGSDGCLAQLGSHALDPGHATVTIGTSGAVRMASSRPQTDAHGRLFTYLLTDDVYITGGATNNGGALLQWLVRDFLRMPLTALQPLVDEALQTDTGPLLCLPYLLGERAPIWNSHATAAFVGIQPGHTAAHFMRAMLEGICFALLSIRQALTETAGPVRRISVSGGFTATPGWIQLLADVFGQEMTLDQQNDASAMGAIILAANVLQLPFGAWEGTPAMIFSPDKEKYEGYQQKYGRFLRLYEAVKEI
ncbi:gluconate kinase, FGGY family [Chitinophaga eiseniae]|uniref:Gluconate kinase, FGGY family n=1 Tax=Chitinophaga eiseniae TaxID=634771 RepID=A0A1T4RLI8_9BACT|nr:gluconokinase [Chitinophaga eiseniae]SKA16854.1 gluconate kinase, FGGY family [Chitinophaga eiseniae]